jgi:hypothetical protein
MPLLPGSYTASVGIHRAGKVCDLRMFAYPFTLTSDRCDLGLISLDHRWTHRPALMADPQPALEVGIQ